MNKLKLVILILKIYMQPNITIKNSVIIKIRSKNTSEYSNRFFSNPFYYVHDFTQFFVINKIFRVNENKVFIFYIYSFFFVFSVLIFLFRTAVSNENILQNNL